MTFGFLPIEHSYGRFPFLLAVIPSCLLDTGAETDIFEEVILLGNTDKVVL